jgi:4'-phosphopantetheinyl transferase EntD
MESLTVLDAWQELLPPSIRVSAGAASGDAASLTVDELASAGDVTSDRMRELEFGRMYAKRALSMLGFDKLDLPIALDRAPLWPSGVVGSLTHVRGCQGEHFAAAVARASDFSAIGIDAEFEGGLDPHVWTQVLTTRELGQIRALPVNARATEVLTRWCIKEAIAKAERQPTEPIEIEIVGKSDGFWNAKNLSQRKSRDHWQARTTKSHGLILAAVVVPR